MATPNITQTTIDLRGGLPEGLEMFDVIEDPRSGYATRHPFGSILFIALCAMLCGMDTCEDFVRFAKAREAWLRKWDERDMSGNRGAEGLNRVVAGGSDAIFIDVKSSFQGRSAKNSLASGFLKGPVGALDLAWKSP